MGKMQLTNYTCAVNHKMGELHLYIMNFCFAVLIMFFIQHLINNDIPSINTGWLLTWNLKKTNHMTGITLRVQKTVSLIFIAPEYEYFNSHKVYKGSIRLQITPHYPDKINSIGFASGIPFTLSTTPLLLQMHQQPESSSKYMQPLSLIPAIHHSQSHTDTHPSLFIFQGRRWALMQSTLQVHAHTEAFPDGAH